MTRPFALWGRRWGLTGAVAAVMLAASWLGVPHGTPMEAQPSHGESGVAAAAATATTDNPIGVQWGIGLDFRVELLTLARTPADAVIAKFRITSYEPEGLSMYGDFARRLPKEPLPSGQMSGISLIDVENHKRYIPLTDSEDKCLCTQFTTFDLEPRNSMEVYAYFPAPPENLTHMTVEFPLAQPFLNVPLGTLNHQAQLPTALPEDDDPQPERRPTQIKTEPEILPLTSRVFGTNNDNAIQQEGEKTTVYLSAKVLFDLNKATLRPAAREEIRDVARRIEETNPSTVQIDGYTDSSGTPAINNPLSKNRAQAVKKALEQTLKGNDINFVARGHGADNPIADNSTAKGRQLNRRVTITFGQ